MFNTKIEVTYYIGKSWVRYKLLEPWLPDGCEKCGLYKGSSFELRLMYLILFKETEANPEQFLCEKCFIEADARYHGFIRIYDRKKGRK